MLRLVENAPIGAAPEEKRLSRFTRPVLFMRRHPAVMLTSGVAEFGLGIDIGLSHDSKPAIATAISLVLAGVVSLERCWDGVEHRVELRRAARQEQLDSVVVQFPQPDYGEFSEDL